MTCAKCEQQGETRKVSIVVWMRRGEEGERFHVQMCQSCINAMRQYDEGY